ATPRRSAASATRQAWRSWRSTSCRKPATGVKVERVDRAKKRAMSFGRRNWMHDVDLKRPPLAYELNPQLGMIVRVERSGRNPLNKRTFSLSSDSAFVCKQVIYVSLAIPMKLMSPVAGKGATRGDVDMKGV